MNKHEQLKNIREYRNIIEKEYQEIRRIQESFKELNIPNMRLSLEFKDSRNLLDEGERMESFQDYYIKRISDILDLYPYEIMNVYEDYKNLKGKMEKFKDLIIWEDIELIESMAIYAVQELLKDEEKFFYTYFDKKIGKKKYKFKYIPSSDFKNSNIFTILSNVLNINIEEALENGIIEKVEYSNSIVPGIVVHDENLRNKLDVILKVEQ